MSRNPNFKMHEDYKQMTIASYKDVYMRNINGYEFMFNRKNPDKLEKSSEYDVKTGEIIPNKNYIYNQNKYQPIGKHNITGFDSDIRNYSGSEKLFGVRLH